MSAGPLRIGDVARMLDVTPRTIRYYEELGLLAPATDRPSGRHRIYTEADIERLREVLRLKDLLGVSVDELRQLLTAEAAQGLIRERGLKGKVDLLAFYMTPDRALHE